ncbi:hypothetical protein Scep_014627 [Stephania cephalantha]|uniref:Uncharacterized protein n=1 Tax=Stephania cephalantha TaxID=152367 RepID=A0AAP0J1J5_9MAGN
MSSEHEMYLTDEQLDQMIEQDSQRFDEEMKSWYQITRTQINQVNTKLENSSFDGEFHAQQMSMDTLGVFSSKSVEENELSTKENFEVSSHKSDTSIAQVQEEARKEIEVILERSKEQRQESKEDQPFMLVNSLTLPQTFVYFDMEVEEKEQLKTFNTTNTFVLDVEDSMDSYVLGVPIELQFLKACVPISMPDAREESIILEYSLLEGIT